MRRIALLAVAALTAMFASPALAVGPPGEELMAVSASTETNDDLMITPVGLILPAAPAVDASAPGHARSPGFASTEAVNRSTAAFADLRRRGVGAPSGRSLS